MTNFIASRVGLKEYSELRNTKFDKRTPPEFCGNTNSGQFKFGKLRDWGNGYVKLFDSDGEFLIPASNLCRFILIDGEEAV